MNNFKLYLRYAGVSLRSQMQYRGSFLMSSFGLFVVCSGEYFGIWALFNRFRSLKGWSLGEVALFYGIITVAFAVAEFFVRGFDEFASLVKSGSFDILLLRPRSAALQVAASKLPLHRLGRFANGLIVLVWSITTLELNWTPGRVALLLLTIAGGACLFAGLFIFQATFSFWSIETLEILNVLTYGGTETAQYPLSIYRPWFRNFFIFVVPLACVSYFPAIAILGRTDEAMGSSRALQYAAPLSGLIFLAVALLVWRTGVKHYCSTGS